MPSIFSKIISGEIPCFKVAETEKCFAFLDIRPLKKGHTLVIPKREVDYIFDLDSEALSILALFAKDVAEAIQSVIPCNRVGLTVMGLEVPHAHIHLIPMDRMDDMNFKNKPLTLDDREMEIIASGIRNKFLA